MEVVSSQLSSTAVCAEEEAEAGDSDAMTVEMESLNFNGGNPERQNNEMAKSTLPPDSTGNTSVNENLLIIPVSTERQPAVSEMRTKSGDNLLGFPPNQSFF